MFDNLSCHGVDPERLCDYVKVDFMVALDRRAGLAGSPHPAGRCRGRRQRRSDLPGKETTTRSAATSPGGQPTPKTTAERAKQAHTDRGLEWRPLEDGMAELELIASATDVMTIFDYVADAIAKPTRAGGPKQGEPGWVSIDALRSDALVALIT